MGAGAAQEALKGKGVSPSVYLLFVISRSFASVLFFTAYSSLSLALLRLSLALASCCPSRAQWYPLLCSLAGACSSLAFSDAVFNFNCNVRRISAQL